MVQPYHHDWQQRLRRIDGAATVALSEAIGARRELVQHGVQLIHPVGVTTFAINLLGSFAVVGLGAKTVPLPAQRVIAFLAIRGRALRRDHVAFSLWPESDENRAQASLRTALWWLGRHAPGLLDTDSDAISITRGVPVDLQRLSDQAQTLSADDASTQSRETIDRYASELLADWYDEWLIAPREVWHHHRVRALEAIAVSMAGRGRFLLAVQAACAAIAAEPTRESSRRILIDVHVAEGNYAQALLEFRRFAELLDEELGTAPSPGLRQRVEQALAS